LRQRGVKVGDFVVRHLKCAVVFLVALCGVAVAQPQLQMSEQAANSFKAASAELSKEVNIYRRRLAGQQLALFDRSQRAWVEYRRAACDFESSGVSGGSAQAMIQEACLENLTQERLKYIQRLSQCEEGDLSCPAARKE
jgi:uncharacterized protein YecT (DUF1311 family)